MRTRGNINKMPSISALPTPARRMALPTLLLLLGLLASFALSHVAVAAGEGFDPKYKIVIQISTADEVTRTTALNNAVNLQKRYGLDDAKVEVVAYGPGLTILTKQSKSAERVKSLAMQNIVFSACNNTMKKIEKKTGKKPELVEGVGIVPSGAARIVELQMQGYSYLRP